MKKSLIIASILLAGTAQASDYSDTATVVQVVPVTVTNSRQICEQTFVPAPNTVQPAQQERGIAGSIIGGILGGLAGHQVGGGSGQTVATIAGAVGGGLIGDHIQNDKPKNIVEANPASGMVAQTSCRVQQEQVPNGFDVSYSYAGKVHITHLGYAPGKTITVDVQAR